MGREMRYCAPRGSPPETLVGFLARKFTYHDAAMWSAQIARGYVSVNGSVEADADRVLRQQDRIVYAPPRELEPAVDSAFTTHYEDAGMIVVGKSGNIPVSEGGRYHANVLCRVVAEAMHKGAAGAANDTSAPPTPAAVEPLLPVHRLDKETSGLVVLAKTRDAAAPLAAQFGGHSGQGEVSAAATKAYDVLLLGTLPCAQDAARFPGVTASNGAQGCAVAGCAGCVRVEVPIGRQADLQPANPSSDTATAAAAASTDGEAPRRRSTTGPSAEDPLAHVRMACFPPNDSASGTKAKHAVTVFHPIRVQSVAADVSVTLARVELFTGRTHQIRLHGAYCGAPVLGDKLYVAGGGTVDVDLYLARARGQAEFTVADTPHVVPRQMLHCALLDVAHPTEAERRVRVEDAGWPHFVRECPWLEHS